MNKKIYTIVPADLTSEERRIAAFLAHGTHLWDLDNRGAGYTVYESTQLLNAADQIRRFYKSDANHGEKFAEKFFQFYLMNSRTEWQIMAEIAEQELAIERVKRLICASYLYHGTAKESESAAVDDELSQAIKTITIADPANRKRIRNAACAMAAWDGITYAAATAYDAPELRTLSNSALIEKKARRLDSNLSGVLYDADNADLLNKKQIGSIADILSRREIGDYFRPQHLATLSRRKTTNDFLTFEAGILPDIYSQLYDDKSNAIRIAGRQNSAGAMADEF